jgi:hypothetical protein
MNAWLEDLVSRVELRFRDGILQEKGIPAPNSLDQS